MTKIDIVKAVAAKVGLTKKKAAEAVDALFDLIKETLCRGEKIQFVGFGKFYVKSRPSRQGRNPKTGKAIQIPAKKVPVFKPAGDLKERIK
jgi:DNA-binding protein HU-beta